MKNTVILKSYKDGIAIYLDDTLEFEQLCLDPVSYTHLTLPTNSLV